VELSGSMCRFLNVGDTNGDGQREILASTYDEGIWSATYADGAWKTERIVPGFASKSFEHATVVFDWDRDVADELFVGSDEQKRIIRVWYDREGGRYRRDTIADFQGPHYLVWNLMSLPAGR
jgi:hypothetical protein